MESAGNKSGKLANKKSPGQSEVQWSNYLSSVKIFAPECRGERGLNHIYPIFCVKWTIFRQITFSPIVVPLYVVGGVVNELFNGTTGI